MYQTDRPTLGATATDPVPAVLSSNDFTTWQRVMSGIACAVPAITPNSATAPDGTQTASRIVFNQGTGGGSGSYSMLLLDVPGTNGALYADSVYLKLTPGASAATLDVRSLIPGIVEANKVVTLTNQWQRFSVTSPPIAGGRQQFCLLSWGSPSLPGGATTQVADVLAWYARVDTGSSPLGVDYTKGANGSGIKPAWVIGGIAAFLLLGNRR